MTSHTDPDARCGRTKQWRAIELASGRERPDRDGVAGAVALAILAAIVLVALFSLPV